jgi:hypothetical protein
MLVGSTLDSLGKQTVEKTNTSTKHFSGSMYSSTDSDMLLKKYGNLAHKVYKCRAKKAEGAQKKNTSIFFEK